MDLSTPKVVAVERGEPRVVALLNAHHALMRATSPEESCHVMEPEALWDAGADVFAIYDGDRALGVGAIKVIGEGHGEIKSMHIHRDARGKGLAGQILETLLEEARRQGLTRLSLETGSDPLFVPARALYARAGFEDCPPFGDYVLDPLSVFMTRTL